MILAFFVAPFHRAVCPDGHDGSGIAGAFHREIISWIDEESQPGRAKVSGWPGQIRAEARTGLYSLALPEPPVFDCRNAAGGVSAPAGDDPFRGAAPAAPA